MGKVRYVEKFMIDPLHDIHLKLLRTFRTVSRSGGFRAAQDELNTSQSTISTSMSHLEQRLGMRLCERGVRGFRLTDQGALVLRASERLFAAMDDFRAEISAAKGRMTGELRIGIADNVATNERFDVPQVLGGLTEQASELSFQLYVADPHELEARVLDGRLQVAIGLFHRFLPELEYAPLFDEEHALYCGAQHQFFHLGDCQITDAMLGAAKYVSRGYLESLGALQVPFGFNAVASSHHMEGLATLILSGKYIAFIPTHYAAGWVAQGAMRAVRANEFTRRVSIHVACKSQGNRSLALTALLDKLNKRSRCSAVQG